MNWYGVTGARSDRNGNPYLEIGPFETTSCDEATDKACGYASSHPNAAAPVLRYGAPYMWVEHAYDRALDEDTVHLKDLVTGHEELRVNGTTVRDTRDGPMPTFDGWQIGEL